MIMKFKQFGFAVLVVTSLCFTGCAAKEEIKQEHSPLFFLNSILALDIRDENIDQKAVEEEVYQRVQNIEQEMSLNSENSEVSRINAQAGIEPVKVSEDTFYVIKSSLKYSELSEGRFDITVGDLVKLWGIGTEHEKLPSDQEIKEALTLVNHRDIELNENQKTVFLKKKGMAIDLGAIAKGYAADVINDILIKDGVKSAIVNLGGNVYVHGNKNGEPFKVGIQNPNAENGGYIGIYQVSDQSVVTSGIYERYFEKDGKRYHHILSTQTGYPVENGLVSVSIISDKSIDGDALSTSVFAMGLTDGMRLISSLPGVEAIFITDNNQVYLSKGATEKFELTDQSFKIED